MNHLGLYPRESSSADFNYLTFTEDTNLTTIPIKFAMPPYDLTDLGTNFTLSDFEQATNGDYFAPTNIFDALGGWYCADQHFDRHKCRSSLTNNQASVVTDPSTAYDGSNFLALADGFMFRTNFLTPQRTYYAHLSVSRPGHFRLVARRRRRRRQRSPERPATTVR